MNNFNSKEIARAFTLYNYQIPLHKIKNENNEIKDDIFCYKTLGFFDGFDTKSFDFSMNFDGSLEKLWEYNNELLYNLDGNLSYQNVFGFRREEPEDGSADKFLINDSSFWAENEQLPLTFITFIQFEKYSDNLTITMIENLLIKIRKELSILEENCKFICYSTIDKNDYIICIKSNKYNNVMNLIRKLHSEFLKEEKCIILYSYTVLSILKKFLNPNLSIEETIDSICITAVINSDSEGNPEDKYDTFCFKLASVLYSNDKEKVLNEKSFVSYEILGEDDCRIIARNVNLKNLLLQFSKDGILNNHNSDFSYCFYTFNTVLNVDTANDGNRGILKSLEKQQQYNKYRANESQKLYESPKCIDLISKINKENCFIKDGLYASLSRPIRQILYSLQVLERAPSRKYDFQSLYEPLKVLISILVNREVPDKKGENNEIIFPFLEGISSIIQGTMRTDIQFFKVNDFNVLTYYAPAKLRAYYSALANQCSKYYSILTPQDEGISYPFIIKPGLYSFVYVEQLWKEDLHTDKLMLVNIPEKDLYSVKSLSFQLAHEVAHFVGNEGIRKREIRFDNLLKILLSNIYHIIKFEIFDFINSSEDSEKNAILVKTIYEKFINDKFETFYCGMLKQISQVKRNVIKQLKNDRWKKESDCYYTQNVPELIRFILTEKNVSKCSYYKLFLSCIDSVHYKENATLEDIKNSINYINKMKTIINKFFEGEYFEDKIKNVFLDYFLNDIFSECYADISAIIALGVSPKEYFKIMCEKYILSKSAKNNQNLSSISFRTFIILVSMSEALKKADDNYLTKWKDIEKIIYEFQAISIAGTPQYEFYMEIKTLNDEYNIDFTKLNYKAKYEKSFLQGFKKQILDLYLVKYCAEYITECVKEYIYINNEQNTNLRTDLINMFQVLSSGHLNQMVDKINNYVYLNFESNEEDTN